jgi:hypothetical protein
MEAQTQKPKLHVWGVGYHHGKRGVLLHVSKDGYGSARVQWDDGAKPSWVKTHLLTTVEPAIILDGN